MTYEDLAQRVVAGDQRAIARAISVVENETAEAAPLLGPLFGRAGRARVVGLTGAPGVGKSTLVDRLTAEWRSAGQRVGVIAVDPTSPFTGGAVLGDRVRMQAHAGDSGVYVRSMATRGHLGGLARATGDAVLVLDAAGHEVVVIETVGVGQGEVDIARTADVSIVVTVPGTGDDVQALKAGIMEIADIFVVNKADREGADRAVAEIEAMLGLKESPGEARPPVCKTQAATGAGVAPLVREIDALARGARDRGRRRKDRARLRLRAVLTDRFLDAVGAEPIDAAVERVVDGTSDPYREADGILDRALAGERVAAPDPAGGGSRVAEALKDGRDAVKAVLDHVGIAVGDLGEALAFYREALGIEVEATEEVPSQGVRAHFLRVGSASLELLEATSESGPIGRYLTRRGPGLHHLTLRVEDIHAALRAVAARGAKLIDTKPRDGAEGALVAFIHPSSAHGVLVELKQERR